ncbi:MAG: alpha-L-arabinofuranosidase C-terminal domain-containing protein [Verrucomicrobiota bacterium]
MAMHRLFAKLRRSAAVTAGLGFLSVSAWAQSNEPIVLRIDAGKVAAKVSPQFYGLMTEEINYSYEGGLYGELVRNRTFKANPTNAIYWSTVGDVTLTLDTNQPLNEALNVSLKVDASKASKQMPAGIANDGYWGIPVRPNTTYRVSFYARAEHFTGPLTVSLINTNVSITNLAAAGKKSGYTWKTGYAFVTLASAEVSKVSKSWRKYEVTLKTGNVTPSKDNRLVITMAKPGKIWFSQVSLFPPTFNNRPNGNRPDLMQLLAGLNPSFLRFPGGNYLEGNTIATRFDWKKTIGDISERPGHMNDGWHYWSTDGMGLLEFLNWCEDLHMQPVLAVYAGYSLRGQRVAPGADLEPYVQDALDEIEYVTGGVKTKWGARRAKDGHPKPFALEYVEAGNEDWFDKSGSYDARFAQFYDAIKAKYPKLQVIATTRIRGRTPDVVDDHFYRNAMQMQADTTHYDKTDRQGPKIFVGEWATREGSPTPNMNAALGDAAWMTGMERNSDLVIMHCYAPLFVNVNPGGMQWRTDLIGYDALNSYGSPAYYAQQMFSANRGDVVLAAEAENIQTRQWQPPAPRRNGVASTNLPPPVAVPNFFYNVTRDTKEGVIIIKAVNPLGSVQAARIEIAGAAGVESQGRATILQAAAPEDTNSIDDPVKIVPAAFDVENCSDRFVRSFSPYSITVLRLKLK